MSEFLQCLTVHVRDLVSPVLYRTLGSSPMSFRTWVIFPSVLPYVSEFALYLTIRVWVSPRPFPCVLPYVIEFSQWLTTREFTLYLTVCEFPHCHTVREWVSPVTYCTWVFPLSLCTLVNFHSILQCVSFPSVLLHVCKFPYWSTLREFQCLTVREFP